MSDLNGYTARRDNGYRAQWELAAKPGPNPYGKPGAPDDGTLYAYFTNKVYLNGEPVINRKACLPDFAAASEEQLRSGEGLPTNLPKPLIHEALAMLQAEQGRQENLVSFKRPHARRPSNQMAAEMFEPWGR